MDEELLKKVYIDLETNLDNFESEITRLNALNDNLEDAFKSEESKKFIRTLEDYSVELKNLYDTLSFYYKCEKGYHDSLIKLDEEYVDRKIG